MEAAGDTVHPPLFRRHARRPRLTRLLDESTAQAIVITAPAGYGKTTLATEWLQGRDKVLWYRSTSASADVAAFSAGLSDVISELLPGTGERLKQRLRVADTPERAARPLAELLAHDIAAWPKDALLVVDDYQLVADSAPVEDFFDWLLTLSPQLRVLVTGRRRPRWASARRILYGEIAEIGRDQLAMNAEEAARVLGDDRSSESVQALVRQAEGWPALIGLAALTASREIPTERVSEALYRYFAEEVVRGEAPEVERFMLLASVPATVDARIAREVLGLEAPEGILKTLVSEGLLSEAGDEFRFHPLLRSFLQRRLMDQDPNVLRDISAQALSDARERQRWEEAFDLALQLDAGGEPIKVLVEATPTMLATGRIETLERWLADFGPSAIHSTGATLTRVEILIRKGQLAEAAAIAKDLVARLPNESLYASRAYALAGQALYLGSGSEQAIEFHRRALDLATEKGDLKRSLWGLFMTENELGSDGADAHLAELEAMASDDADLDTRLRVAVGRQATGARKGSFGGVLETSLPLVPIAALADDPMARTTFLANVSYLCVAHADYSRGLELATKALRESEILGLAFAKGYCLATIALAHAGLRAYRSAHQALRDLASVASDQDNTYLECSAEITSMRVALMRGDAEGAVEGRSLEFVDSIPVAGAKGEYLGALSVGAAALGNVEMSQASVARAERSGSGIESRFFTQWARLIVASRQGVATTDAFWELFEAAAEASFEDIFVIGYRLQPALLDLVQRKDPRARKVVGVLKRANDHAIASSRFPADAPFDLQSTLTPREHEVLGLLAAGLSNAEIAERLFISPSTAKVHVQHILRKLGVKTRLQAAMQAESLSEPID
jgi:LuxR family transcriptional regulator, maltose regulon positive regulatory protein